MSSCSILIGNTTQFKSDYDSQKLCLHFVLRTVQSESIFRKTEKRNNCTATLAQNSEVMKYEYLRLVPIEKYYTANIAQQKCLTTNIVNTRI